MKEVKPSKSKLCMDLKTVVCLTLSAHINANRAFFFMLNEPKVPKSSVCVHVCVVMERRVT